MQGEGVGVEILAKGKGHGSRCPRVDAGASENGELCPLWGCTSLSHNDARGGDASVDKLSSGEAVLDDLIERGSPRLTVRRRSGIDAGPRVKPQDREAAAVFLGTRKLIVHQGLVPRRWCSRFGAGSRDQVISVWVDVEGVDTEVLRSVGGEHGRGGPLCEIGATCMAL
jgi:hypothetical protein